MGYFICPTDGYYEGDKRHPDDTEIFVQRPHYVCTWNGASWDYPLAESRRVSKNDFMASLEAYCQSLTQLFGISIYEIFASSMFGAEMRYLADNPSATDSQLPLLAAYALQMGGGATKGDAVTQYESDHRSMAAMLGKIIAYRFDKFAEIDAAVYGLNAMQVVFDGDDIV